MDFCIAGSSILQNVTQCIFNIHFGCKNNKMLNGLCLKKRAQITNNHCEINDGRHHGLLNVKMQKTKNTTTLKTKQKHGTVGLIMVHCALAGHENKNVCIILVFSNIRFCHVHIKG